MDRVDPIAQRTEDEHDRNGDKEGDRLELAGEDHGDDEDRDEVVDHRERKQQCTDAVGQALADDGEHPEGKRDVGGRRDRPSASCVAVAGNQQVDDRAGTITPPTAAIAGMSAFRGVSSSPCRSSCFSSMAARKKKIASRPSVIQCPMLQVQADRRDVEVRVADGEKGRSERRCSRA